MSLPSCRSGFTPKVNRGFTLARGETFILNELECTISRNGRAVTKNVPSVFAETVGHMNGRMHSMQSPKTFVK